MSKVRKVLGRYKRKLLGTQPPSSAKTAPVEIKVPLTPLEEKHEWLLSQRTMGSAAWAQLGELLQFADEVLPAREAVRKTPLPSKAIVLRHDIDYDVENAVVIAQREAALGIRSTFFPLHSAWYYRWESGTALSPLMMRALETIASLGHEIGLHNNAITVALETGRDPVEVMREELDALRAHFDVVGTVAHGDRMCREVGYVNSEVFTEHPRPKLGAPDRMLTRSDASGNVVAQVQLHPVPMKELGLEYEAGFVGHRLYLSDTGGRWSTQPGEIRLRFAADQGPLQVMTHPVYWGLSGETPRPRPLVKGRRPERSSIEATPIAHERPMRIISRGDCCSRRALHFNKDLFGGAFEYTADEKSRTDFFLEHDYVGSPTEVEVRTYLDVDRMGKSQQHYIVHQTDRATLGARDADLLVMDSYSDMNFQAWRHRKEGWKIWVHLGYVRDKAAFEEDFEPTGYLTLEESIENHVALIEHYRRINGHIPVLFLNQPTNLYAKLDHRKEFYTLGSELRAAVPDLYFGIIDDAELEPDDMDSSGPGQTLHFTGPSYRKMIEVALDQGLGNWLNLVRQG